MYALLSNLIWYIGYIYSIIRSFDFTYLLQYFYADTNEPLVYAVEDSKMMPWKYSKNNASLYYVILKINDREKILVFNNRYTLINKYGMLKDLVEHNMGKFGHYMDVVNTITNEDHLELFNKYTDAENTFFNSITNYNIKAKDLYDFRNNRYILVSGDKLEVVKMDLESTIYDFEDPLVQETKM